MRHGRRAARVRAVSGDDRRWILEQRQWVLGQRGERQGGEDGRQACSRVVEQVVGSVERLTSDGAGCCGLANQSGFSLGRAEAPRNAKQRAYLGCGLGDRQALNERRQTEADEGLGEVQTCRCRGSGSGVRRRHVP